MLGHNYPRDYEIHQSPSYSDYTNTYDGSLVDVNLNEENDIQANELPQIFKFKENLRFNLNKYREDFSSNISEREMIQLIKFGEEIESKIANATGSEITSYVDELRANRANRNEQTAVVAMMWLLTAQNAYFDRLFVSGGTRLDQGGNPQ